VIALLIFHLFSSALFVIIIRLV